MMTESEQLHAEAFLAELSALSNKYGLEIGSCGCCQSPWISEAEHKGRYTVTQDADNLTFEALS